MDSVFLVFPDEPVGLADIADRLDSLDVVRHPQMLEVSAGGSWLYIDPVADPSDIALYADWPPELVPDRPATVYSVRYRDAALVVRAVTLLARSYPLLVDTDTGRVVDGTALTVAMLPRT